MSEVKHMRGRRLLPLTALFLGIVVARCSGPGGDAADGVPASSDAERAAGALVALPPVPIVPLPGDVLGENLIVNAGFEQATDGAPADWVVAGDGDAACTSAHAARGDSSLRFTVAGSQALSAKQRIKSSGQGMYLLRCLVLTENVGGRVSLAVSEVREQGTRFAVEGEALTGDSTAWRLLQLSFEVPAYVDAFTLSLQHLPVEGASQGTGTIWFDECELFQRAPRQNLVINGNFFEGENGLSGWAGGERSSVSKASSGFGSHDPNCIRIDLPGNQNLGIYRTVSGLTPGKEYIVRGYIKTENVVGDVRFELQHPTKGWKAFLKYTDAVTGTHDWTWVKLAFTVPEDCDQLNVYLRRPAAPNAPADLGTIWFAKCEVFPASGAE